MKEINKVKILVVDDEPGILNVIKNIIQGPDCEIITVTSSHEAAELIGQERKGFDIFIIDYQLGNNITGIDLFELVRTEYPDKDYISLFCTAVGTTYIFKEEKDEGLFDFFIEKPFIISDVKKTFDKAVAKLEQLRS